MSVCIANLVQKRELLVNIARNECKNVIFVLRLRKYVQESDKSVYIAALVQKRELSATITRYECKNVIFGLKKVRKTVFSVLIGKLVRNTSQTLLKTVKLAKFGIYRHFLLFT